MECNPQSLRNHYLTMNLELYKMTLAEVTAAVAEIVASGKDAEVRRAGDDKYIVYEITKTRRKRRKPNKD